MTLVAIAWYISGLLIIAFLQYKDEGYVLPDTATLSQILDVACMAFIGPFGLIVVVWYYLEDPVRDARDWLKTYEIRLRRSKS